MSQASPKIEVRKVNEPKDVPLNIARDLKRRIESGKALVAVERPIIALSLIRKRWAQLVREIRVAHASTLNRWRREELSMQATRMEWTEFTATDYEAFADVYVAEPSKAAQLVDQAATIYVAIPLSDSGLKKLLRKMEPDTLVIRYEFEADQRE
ncbi:hypothetical protein [Protofrankia symbiont of Coriaria ruscifolia]|uniref:hypothetical protein n=1 Tax=Protofrankia symbiont of Coriaria ruscifolia TaxID=1306542 RepID=UPI0013EF6056|nr:hypothetical protein [Protofrankia symbiont of Coriaria ruscifolia]